MDVLVSLVCLDSFMSILSGKADCGPFRNVVPLPIMGTQLHIPISSEEKGFPFVVSSRALGDSHSEWGEIDSSGHFTLPFSGTEGVE